jgi:cell shape-determining protein MreC
VIRTDDIEPGDLLITSGLGGIFPKGIPVGTVSKANRKAYGISQEVEVRPSVDFSRLEEVMVVTDTGMGPSAAFNEALNTTLEDNENQTTPPSPTPPSTLPTEPKKVETKKATGQP